MYRKPRHFRQTLHVDERVAYCFRPHQGHATVSIKDRSGFKDYSFATWQDYNAPRDEAVATSVA